MFVSSCHMIGCVHREVPQPYKEHIPEIAQKLQHYDPEVTLAVRFGDSVTVTNAASLSEEDDGLDEFLSLHGFEFVEGDRTYRRPTQDEDRHSDDEDSGQSHCT